MRPLTRLRLQLTAWYGGTFALILFLLGALLVVAITRQMRSELEASLRAATHEIARATATREIERVSAGGHAVDALEELRIPDRGLYLFDTAGHAVIDRAGAAELTRMALRAAVQGTVDDIVRRARPHPLQVHAERFRVASGNEYVAVATADRVELEDRYAALIANFAALAFASLLLVAAGGWLLAGKATAPVERSLAHMRRFMADAAHELRTPISVLRSRVDVALQRERSPAAYSDALANVRRDAAQIGAVVEDLLTLARADAGERPLRRESVQLDEIALDAVSAAGALAERRGVRLTIGRADEAVVRGDPALLRQLAMIVLDNAVKFTPSGGDVTLDVATSDGRALLTVRDTGIGIREEERLRIFDRFWRGEGARERASGAGLGLSIAKWIAEAHGGRIEVQSEVGKGTTVTVSVQRAEE